MIVSFDEKEFCYPTLEKYRWRLIFPLQDASTTEIQLIRKLSQSFAVKHMYTSVYLPAIHSLFKSHKTYIPEVIILFGTFFLS